MFLPLKILYMRLHHTSQTTKLILVIEFILVAYLLYALTVNVYKSYKLDLHIRTFEAENQLIAAENEQKSTDFQYYTSDQYIDKIAKQNFGLVNPGEEVIVLPPEDVNVGAEAQLIEDAALLDEISGLSNSEKWWKFFFDR